jgi:Leucine-rich repeat (LRR) protein
MKPGNPGSSGPAAGVSVQKQRKVPTLQKYSADKVAAGLPENEVLAGTFNWESLNLSYGQEDLVKIAFARKHYLKTSQDIGQQLGVDIGGFSVRELLNHKIIPVRVSVSGGLNLSNKKINDMTGFERIAGLTNLAGLRLDNNQLTELPAGVFAGLTNLAGLRLGNNQLTELPAGVFADLTNLQTLHLNNNQLTTLPAGVFAGLTNLLLLVLSNNHLTTLPAGVFAGLTRLLALHLENNYQLRGIEPKTYLGEALQELFALSRK